MFCKKDILKSFTKFTGKHLCWSLFFKKVTGLQACNSINKETPTQVFYYEFCEIFKKTPPVAASYFENCLQVNLILRVTHACHVQ